jgi:hypothetical protein
VGPLVRNSAGITIVENRAPAWAPGEEWSVSAQPTLDIGVMAGAFACQFYRVAGAAYQLDGGIAVADNGTSEIRFWVEEYRRPGDELDVEHIHLYPFEKGST